MNKTEYLLIHLMEEAAEVQQAASKCLRFGFDGYNPDDPMRTTNSYDLKQELKDLRATEVMLAREGHIECDQNLSGLDLGKKIEKIEHYMNVSKRCGTLNDDP